MKIAIVGGGWVGCHLAKVLKSEDVVLIDKNEKLFSETSFRNQNRLHRGFHYARNSKTRKLCQDTFVRFLQEYGDLVDAVPDNWYCVPEVESTIDYGTFKKIFYDLPGYYPTPVKPKSLTNIEGGICVDERYINFKKAHEYFNRKLSGVYAYKDIKDVNELVDEFDLVINCTNNHLKDPNCPTSYYELALTLLYKKKAVTEFGALTLVDGEFFSIYPYQDDIFTLSDVEHTPILRTKNLDEIQNFVFREDKLEKKKEQFTDKILRYYPGFSDDFEYYDYFLSTKSKFNTGSADRYPYISMNGKVIHCFTGKIQGIYVIEEYVKSEVFARRNRSYR